MAEGEGRLMEHKRHFLIARFSNHTILRQGRQIFNGGLGGLGSNPQPIKE
jgi:hypothetical protein